MASPLPIELLSFTGEVRDAENALHWITATETDNDRFELERSAEGVNWELISTVEGAGSSQGALHYEAIDARPFDLTYYRLRQVDYDGTWTLSEVIALERDGLPGELLIYPNPGNDRVTIAADGDASIDLVEVIAADGRVVLRTFPLTSSKRIDLNVHDLAIGIYQVRASSKGVRRSASLVKVDL
jgi:hypothetical protein